MIRQTARILCLVLTTAAVAAPAFAQDDDPAVLSLAEPDFNLVSLPTALRLPIFGSAFRVTHRFTRPLGEGTFGDLAGDLFGLDSEGQIGLEYRFGLIPNGQVAIHRTSDRTIQFTAEYSVLRQAPFDVTALASMEGADNFTESYSPVLGAILSRRIGGRAAFYIEPMWVNNSNRLPSELADDNDTVLLGLGGRVRIRPTVYIAGEFVPRVAGFSPNTHHGSIALEKRAGGHLFQLNFSTSIATTMAQLARGGGAASDEWYLGFNISRKFF